VVETKEALGFQQMLAGVAILTKWFGQTLAFRVVVMQASRRPMNV
jgi:hypothetical protein